GRVGVMSRKTVMPARSAATACSTPPRLLDYQTPRLPCRTWVPTQSVQLFGSKIYDVRIVPPGLRCVDHTVQGLVFLRRCLMIRTTAFEARQRQERLDAKTLDNLFRRRIEEGAKCSPFVSAAILQIVKEVFPLQPDDLGKQLDLGQVKLLIAAAHEPAG